MLCDMQKYLYFFVISEPIKNSDSVDRELIKVIKSKGPTKGTSIFICSICFVKHVDCLLFEKSFKTPLLEDAWFVKHVDCLLHSLRWEFF